MICISQSEGPVMIRRGRAAAGDSWFFLLSMVFDDVVLLRRGER